MPIFKVKRVVNASVIYRADVEADTAEKATELSKRNEDAYAWGKGEIIEHADRTFVTLNAEGRIVSGGTVMKCRREDIPTLRGDNNVPIKAGWLTKNKKKV